MFAARVGKRDDRMHRIAHMVCTIHFCQMAHRTSAIHKRRQQPVTNADVSRTMQFSRPVTVATCEISVKFRSNGLHVTIQSLQCTEEVFIDSVAYCQVSADE